jgi:hypothetical protein
MFFLFQSRKQAGSGSHVVLILLSKMFQQHGFFIRKVKKCLILLGEYHEALLLLLVSLRQILCHHGSQAFLSL